MVTSIDFLNSNPVASSSCGPGKVERAAELTAAAAQARSIAGRPVTRSCVEVLVDPLYTKP